MLLISTPASIEEKKQRLLALAKRKREEVAATAKSRLGLGSAHVCGHQWNNHQKRLRDGCLICYGTFQVVF